MRLPDQPEHGASSVPSASHVPDLVRNRTMLSEDAVVERQDGSNTRSLNESRIPSELLDMIYGYILDDCRDTLESKTRDDRDNGHHVVNQSWRGRLSPPPPPPPPGPLCILSRLGRVSKPLRKRVLPLLYASTTLESKQDVPSLLVSGIPQGWQFTRFLYIDEDTFDQLNTHERLTTDSPDSDVGLDLRIAFPLLALVCVTKAQGNRNLSRERRALHVELYEVITWKELDQRCASSDIDRDAHRAGRRGTSVFDVFCGGEAAYSTYEWNNIESLVIRSGTGIIAPRNGEFDYRRYESSGFSLAITDPLASDNILKTLDFIFDCLATTWWGDFCRNRTDSYFWVNLVCHPVVLDACAERLRTCASMFIELDITLLGNNTTETVVTGLLEDIADVYAAGFKMYRYGVAQDFVVIRSEYVEQVWGGEDGDYREKTKNVLGKLSKGRKGDPLPVECFDSFHATVVSSSDSTTEDLEDVREFHLRTYTEGYLETRMQRHSLL